MNNKNKVFFDMTNFMFFSFVYNAFFLRNAGRCTDTSGYCRKICAATSLILLKP